MVFISGFALFREAKVSVQKLKSRVLLNLLNVILCSLIVQKQTRSTLGGNKKSNLGCFRNASKRNVDQDWFIEKHCRVQS